MDEALDIALKVFWRKGYEGTSIDDLTKAMGINRPSLYCAFGNKEELFRKALDRYAEGPAALYREALGKPTARGVAERLLRGIADALRDPRNPPGCLAVQAALSCGEAADPIRWELNCAAGGRRGRPARAARAGEVGGGPAGGRLTPPISPDTSRRSPRGWRSRRPAARAARLRRVAEMALSGLAGVNHAARGRGFIEPAWSFPVRDRELRAGRGPHRHRAIDRATNSTPKIWDDCDRPIRSGSLPETVAG